MIPARQVLLSFCILLGGAMSARAADAPKLHEFAMQQSDATLYYRVRFETPDKVVLPVYGEKHPHALARLPRLLHDDPRAAGHSLLPVSHTRFTPALLE